MKNYIYFESTLKRLGDIVGSILAILVLFPVFLIVALCIKIEDYDEKIIFKQNRIGHQGKIFQIYKFRTMYKNAEKQLKKDESLYEKYKNNGYKLSKNEDFRITRVGKFLRKTSLDELPQFFNVLKGNMSLVGPRPIVEAELDEYGTSSCLFTRMKPGLTGAWQVVGRGKIGYPKRIGIELSYLSHASVSYDFKIMFLTIFKVLKREGAH
ncbi:sugar transferase [Vagococcus carniphilus]|uniref:sugar transferase n=1 Tax=Vagococcus carniphilus TaxID=218144 RepID=UPI00288E3E58|nr:sugar transferase [Vagococcus carniphilus]MDT2865911.1 sugar transferase [Vagococcus carniphilus]